MSQFGALDDPHARKAADSRPVPALRGRQDDRYPLAIPDGEFLDHPRGEGIVPANDQVTPACLRAGKGRHAGDLS